MSPFKYHSYDHAAFSWNLNPEDDHNADRMTHVLFAALRIKWGMKEEKYVVSISIPESGIFGDSDHLLNCNKFIVVSSFLIAQEVKNVKMKSNQIES